MRAPDLQEELWRLQQASRQTHQAITDLAARLRDRRSLTSVKELHDVKAELEYLRFALRSAQLTAASLAQPRTTDTLRQDIEPQERAA